MRRITITAALLLAPALAAAQDPCADLARQGQQRAAVGASVAPELTAPRANFGAPTGVLAQALDEAQTADSVLLRMRFEKCQAVAAGPKPATATTASATAPAAVSPNDPAAYKPKTAHDNTPWRFDMSQNGKRMTAEEFDAWMKARGVRVAKGAPKPAAAPVPTPAPAEAPKGN